MTPSSFPLHTLPLWSAQYEPRGNALKAYLYYVKYVRIFPGLSSHFKNLCNHLYSSESQISSIYTRHGCAVLPSRVGQIWKNIWLPLGVTEMVPKIPKMSHRSLGAEVNVSSIGIEDF